MYLYLFGLLPTLALSGPCYTVTNQQNQVVFMSDTPPFDLSGPPDSPEYATAKAKGYKLRISPVCPSIDNPTNADIMHDLATTSNHRITATIYRQQQKDEYLRRQQKFLADAQHELLRAGEHSVNHLRHLNDLEDQWK